MDNVVKLDMFEYELEDIGDDPYDKYVIIHIAVDSDVDPVIADIFNEIKVNPHVHVGGRYFLCKRIEVYRDPTGVNSQISLLTTEEFRKGEAINEIR